MELITIHRFAALCVCVLLMAACAGPGGGDTKAPTTGSSTAPTSSDATTTTTTSTASTTTPAVTITTSPPGVGADYYRYGDDGLVRVVDGIETQLIDGSIVHVWDDHMGGTITADVTAIDILHLRAGDTTPTPVVRRSGYTYARFTGIIDDHPSLFFAGIPEGAELGQWPCGDWALNSRDLVTGEERRHLCLPIEDAGLDIRSVGGELFVGAPYGLCNGAGTSSSIRFWDIVGNPIAVPANPFPPTESCVPCELDALISPDGVQLAYRHRPDSFHHDSPYYSGPACGGGTEQVEAWWEGSKDVPAEVLVIDIETGAPSWRIEVPAETRLSDFDGRHLVVAQEGGSTIYDTQHEHSPLWVPGNVTLIRRPVGALDS